MNKLNKMLLLVVGLMIGFTVHAQTANAATLEWSKSGYMYERQYGDGSHHSSYYLEDYYIDSEVAYCIEPGTPEGNPIYLSDWEHTKLPPEITERLALIAYYGYTYPGHQTRSYRAATQGMIWKTIMGDGSWIKFSTALWSAGTMLDVSSEEAEIERLIAHHGDVPSFNAKSYKLQVGETLELTDTNGVLDQFTISVSGANYTVNGNTLTVIPTTSGKISLNMTKKMPYENQYKVFVGDKHQNMLVPGTTDPVIAKIVIDSYSTPVTLHKTDVETGTPQGQATLKGAEYGVYEAATGRLVTTLVTDENGFVESNPMLESKEYYLQELKPSEGYLLDPTRYNFDARGKESVTVNVTEKVIKNYISILKQYEVVNGDTTFLNAEANITFEIYYPNGNKFDQITTDENGYASINIPYGIWRFHQVNSTEGFEKIYDFYVIVDENSSEEQYYNILNNAITAYLKVIKVDEETGKTIALADTTFKILNTDTNQYVSQYVAGKVYSEFKTDKNGIMQTYLELPPANYKLIEVSSPNGYLLDDDGLQFTIGNNTTYTYTNYGAIITVSYKNTPIKGQLEIHKTGEELVVKDNEFIYESKPLDNVVFEIYAEEDIISSDGSVLYYKAGTRVDVLTTSKTGYAISKKLPLGKYFLIEVSSNNPNYIVDNQKHYFTLKEVDNKTPIVYESYSALNYLKKGTLEFTKTDLVNGDPIPDTIISIYTIDDRLIYTGKSDSEGKIVVNNIMAGKYYIVEKVANEAYVLSEEKAYFEIKEDGEIVKANMTNKPKVGTLEFTKTDLVNGDPIPNTVIVITNSKNEVIFSGKTNELGEIVIPEIRYGKYTISEKIANEAYVLSEEKAYFEIKEDGEIVKANMTNKPKVGTLEFTKTDLVNGNPIPNTLINVYTEYEELIFSGRTNELGMIVIPELRYGRYYILEKETASPDYILNTEKMYFEIKEDGEIVKANMTNEKVVVDVPITGVTDSYIPEIAGVILIITGIGAIIYVEIQKRKN